MTVNDVLLCYRKQIGQDGHTLENGGYDPIICNSSFFSYFPLFLLTRLPAALCRQKSKTAEINVLAVFILWSMTNEKNIS